LVDDSTEQVQKEYALRSMQNLYALGKSIMDVESYSAKRIRLVPVIEEAVVDGKVKMVVTGLKAEKIQTLFKEPLTTDLTKANLDPEDMMELRILLDVFYQSKHYAENYGREENIAPLANYVCDLFNARIIASRSKEFRAAILAKSDINVQEASSKQWSFDSAVQEENKKKGWKFFGR